MSWAISSFIEVSSAKELMTTSSTEARLRAIYNTAIDEVHEQQANSFAASFLMPERLLRRWVSENPDEPLKKTASAFQVSPSAMRWRLKTLDLYRQELDLDR